MVVVVQCGRGQRTSTTKKPCSTCVQRRMTLNASADVNIFQVPPKWKRSVKRGKWGCSSAGGAPVRAVNKNVSVGSRFCWTCCAHCDSALKAQLCIVLLQQHGHLQLKGQQLHRQRIHDHLPRSLGGSTVDLSLITLGGWAGVPGSLLIQLVGVNFGFIWVLGLTGLDFVVMRTKCGLAFRPGASN